MTPDQIEKLKKHFPFVAPATQAVPAASPQGKAEKAARTVGDIHSALQAQTTFANLPTDDRSAPQSQAKGGTVGALNQTSGWGKSTNG